jgi:hypothetical protein
MTGSASAEEEFDEGEENGPVVPDDLDEAVRVRASSDEDDFNPSSRMADVRQRASGYEREYRLKLIHRLLMRQIPIDQIAEQLDVSINTVKRDRSELYRRLKQAAKKLDINLLVGDSIGFYKEISAMAMRIASNRKVPVNQKLQALRTAAGGRNDMHRFLSTVGVYDALRYRREKDKGQSDIDKLMSLTEKLISDDLDEDTPEVMEGMEAFSQMEDDDLEINIV